MKQWNTDDADACGNADLKGFFYLRKSALQSICVICVLLFCDSSIIRKIKRFRAKNFKTVVPFSHIRHDFSSIFQRQPQNQTFYKNQTP